jgi:hypothetical protein
MSESTGVPIGRSNVLTHTRSRVPAGPDPDASPGLRDRLHALAARALEGREAFIHDAAVGGRRVRLFSNSHHLADFWRDAWPTEADRRRDEGKPLPPGAVLTVYAAIDVPGEPEASCSSAASREVFLFNTSFYGDLRAVTMAALDRLLAPAGERLLHGAAIELEGKGIILLYPKEVIHPTPTWGLMELPGARFLADGWLLLDPAGRVSAVEKSVYLRASTSSSYPDLAAGILSGKLENVPDPGEKAAGPLERLAASDNARALVSPAALLGKTRVAEGPLTPAAVFALKAGPGEPLEPAAVPPFPGPGHVLRPGAVPGHPREVARLIARALGR